MPTAEEAEPSGEGQQFSDFRLSIDNDRRLMEFCATPAEHKVTEYDLFRYLPMLLPDITGESASLITIVECVATATGLATTQYCFRCAQISWAMHCKKKWPHPIHSLVDSVMI